MQDQEGSISFRGPVWTCAVPLVIFLAITITLVVRGAPQVEGMILAAMVGISAGMLFSTNVAAYSERIFSLMANRVSTVAIVCWLWAGAFSGILGASGLVEANVWIGWKLGLTGPWFTATVFLFAALFAVSVGTGLGTIIGFTTIMYPAGIVLGCDPAALLGAIFSGAAFGDNLAPISDTTIVSAATQQTDVGGVVRSRLKYVVIAGAVTFVLLLFAGGADSSIAPEQAQAIMEKTADPHGLPMLLPAVIVFVVAVAGYHFLAALTAGTVAAVLLGWAIGVFLPGDLFHVTPDGQVGGKAVEGAMGLVPTAILTLLLVVVINLLREGGLLRVVMEWLDRTLARTVRGAEMAIVALISLTNLSVSVNTVAMITAGPLANELRKRHNLHPYRSANLLDTISCSFPYFLPYSATVPVALAIEAELSQQYDFVPVISWSAMVPYMFYGWTLLVVMLLAVATGFGRRRG